MSRFPTMPATPLDPAWMSLAPVPRSRPAEWENYSGYSIRIGVAGNPVAVLIPVLGEGGLHECLADDASLLDGHEEIFDLRSLELRVANLRRGGFDASVSEAALTALRRAAAIHMPAKPQAAFAMDQRGASSIDFAILALAIVVLSATFVLHLGPVLTDAFGRSGTTLRVEQARIGATR